MLLIGLAVVIFFGPRLSPYSPYTTQGLVIEDGQINNNQAKEVFSKLFAEPGKAPGEIAKEMGFEVKHQPTDWAAIVPSLKAGKIDFIASGMSITPERQAQVNFTEPYWQVIQLMVVKKDADMTVEKCLEEGRKIGLLRGSAEYKWVTENLLKKGYKFELRPYDTTPLAIEDVANGRIDGATVSNTALKEATDRGLPVKSIGRYGQPDVNYGYAVRKEDKEFLDALNEGLKRLKASPTWKELVKKWDMK